VQEKKRGKEQEKVKIHRSDGVCIFFDSPGSFRVESSPGHGSPIHRSNQVAPPAAAADAAGDAATATLLFLFRSFSPRRVASRELTGEAGHLKYSSDAGLNEARPNVNLSTCF